MRKFFMAVAVALLVALAAPAFAAINPFIDVPVNHWAYDAIGQLAARGILSGYPDGTYKGRQPTTRYEMASALARALALVDMNKASRQDVELIKKLVLEFKDELDALGVTVDGLYDSVSVLERRLGGWRIGMLFRQDIGQVTRPLAIERGTVENSPNAVWDDSTTNGYIHLHRARIMLDRWFGENENMRFHARFQGEDVNYYTKNARANNLAFTRFFVEMPIWWGIKMTVGRSSHEQWDAPYYLDSGLYPFSWTAGMGSDSWLHSRAMNKLVFERTWGIGDIRAYVGRAAATTTVAGPDIGPDFLQPWWEVYFGAGLLLSERWGGDLGIQLYFPDPDTRTTRGTSTEGAADNSTDYDMGYTAHAGLRFEFTRNIGLRGRFYAQNLGNMRSDIIATGGTSGAGFSEGAIAATGIIAIRQELLRFTTLWLEFNYLEQGFWVPTGRGAALVNNAYDWGATAVNRGYATYTGSTGGLFSSGFLNYDTNIFRVAAMQTWRERWSTWQFWALYDPDEAAGARDLNMNHFGIGIHYQHSPNIGLGLSMQGVNYAEENKDAAAEIRIRTSVAF